MSSTLHPTFHADVVGSMLRPQELVDARAAMRAGKLPADEYAVIEDHAVDTALSIQEQAGVDVVTDGEQRRDIFFDFFVSGLDGLAPIAGETVRFRGKRPEDAMEVTVPFSVVGKIAPRPCPALAEFAYARAHTDKPVKVTLPSPMMILAFWNEASREAYPDPFALCEDVADAVRGWVRELHEAGCAYVQIDAPELNEAYADASVRAEHESRGIPSDKFISLGTEFVGSIADIETPGMLKGLHVCKGNGTQSWIAEGGYEDFSRVVFDRASRFDVFHLEYDDERSGSFEPLRNLPDDKLAVLGLVSTKWTRLEDPDVLRARAEEAAQFHPKEHLGLATQCGFASANETAEQRKITPQTQSDKLKLVADVAHSIWSQ